MELCRVQLGKLSRRWCWAKGKQGNGNYAEAIALYQKVIVLFHDAEASKTYVSIMERKIALCQVELLKKAIEIDDEAAIANFVKEGSFIDNLITSGDPECAIAILTLSAQNLGWLGERGDGKCF